MKGKRTSIEFNQIPENEIEFYEWRSRYFVYKGDTLL